MRLVSALVCVALSCSCASALRPVYVAPDDVVVVGEGTAYPNESAKNVVTFSSGLPMAARELTLTCADGKTESVELVNDGIDPIGLVSTLALAALTASNVASAARSVELGDQIYYGALAALTGGAGLLTALTSWQPSLPVRVNHPGSVCQSAKTDAIETPATPPTPATPSPDAPPAPMEPTPAAESAAPAAEPASPAASPEA